MAMMGNSIEPGSFTRSGDFCILFCNPQPSKSLFDIATMTGSMTFSDAYGNVLSPFVKNYKMAKNEKGRNGVLKDAVEAVRKSGEVLEDKGSDLPKDLRTVCFFILAFLII